MPAFTPLLGTGSFKEPGHFLMPFPSGALKRCLTRTIGQIHVSPSLDQHTGGLR